MSTPSIFCVSCGRKLADTSRFCNSCSTPIRGITSSVQRVESLVNDDEEWFNATCVNCSNEVLANKKIKVSHFKGCLLFFAPLATIIYVVIHLAKIPRDCPTCWENVDVSLITGLS